MNIDITKYMNARYMGAALYRQSAYKKLLERDHTKFSLEQEIMDRLDIGHSPTFLLGHRQAMDKARDAAQALPTVLKDYSLKLDPIWEKHIKLAQSFDNTVNQGGSIQNIWEACSCAICDAILGGGQITPDPSYFFAIYPKNIKGWKEEIAQRQSFDLRLKQHAQSQKPPEYKT